MVSPSDDLHAHLVRLANKAGFRTESFANLLGCSTTMCVVFCPPPHAVCVLGCPSTSCVSPVINDLVTSSLLLFLCKCSASPAGQVQSPLLLEDVGSVEGLRSLDYSPTPETLLSAELAHLLQGPLAAACPILVRASSPFILAFGYCVEGGWFN